MLLAVLCVTSAREVAARCRVHESVVSRWASGQIRPGPAAREMLERWSGYRIPAAAWEPAARPGQRRVIDGVIAPSTATSCGARTTSAAGAVIVSETRALGAPG